MQLFFLGDVRRRTGATTRQLERLFERRPDLEPTEKAAGRRIFTASLVRRIEATLKDEQRARGQRTAGGCR